MAGSVTSEASRLRPWLAALALLVIGLALTVGGAVAASEAWLVRQQDELADHTQIIGAELDDRLAAYAAAQRTLAEVLEGSEVFSRGLFMGFTEGLGLSARFPEVRQQSFVQVVPAHAVGAFEDAQRADGAPGFRVRPAADQGKRYVVTYTTGATRLGADLAGRPRLRAAFARAGDQGRTIVVGGFTPLRLATPVYIRGADDETVAGRRAALRGWVMLTVDGKRLVTGLAELGDVGTVWLTDADGTVLVSSGELTSGGTLASLGAELEVERFGRTWSLEVDAGAPALLSRRELLIAILTLGALLSLLLAGLVGSLLRLRQLRRATPREAPEVARPADLNA